MMDTARETMIEHYLDYRNNYASFYTWAEQNGLEEAAASEYIIMARAVFNSAHPDR